jgi:hypothetical protein
MDFYDKYFIKKKDNAYIISLNEPKELFKKLEQENLNPILIKAIDGKTLDYKTKSENTNLFFSLFGPETTVAIALSHIKAWEEIVKSKESYGVVFEDDAILVENFNEKYNDLIKNLPKDFDIFYLGCFGCENNYNFLNVVFSLLNLKSKFKKINDKINKPSVALALHGYIISKKGIKKILEHLKGNIYFHLDVCIQKMIYDNLLIAYVPNERIVYQSSTDNNLSSNVKNSHPIILNNFLSNFTIDTKCRANYVTTVSLLKIGDYTLTLNALTFVIMGIYLGYLDFDFLDITAFYFIISIPDIKDIKDINLLNPDLNLNNLKINSISVHYIILILSYLITKEKLNYVSSK